MISAQFLCTLGADPEPIKEVKGTRVTEFRAAVDVYDPSTRDNRTQWVTVTVWGGRAEPVAQWLHKGSQCMVVGSLTVREYETRDGRAGYSVEVKASAVEFTRGGERNDRGSQRGDSDRDNNRDSKGRDRDDGRQRGGGWGDNRQRGGEQSGQRGGYERGNSGQGGDPIPF